MIESNGNIFFARHCRTQWNEQDKLQGKVDVDLSVAGKAEAFSQISSLQEYGFDIILSSHLKRAKQTAEIYSHGLSIPCMWVDGLEEIDHGDWEGKRFSELESKTGSAYQQWLKDPGLFPIPGSNKDVFSSVDHYVDAVEEIKKRYNDKRVLVISHKHIFALFVARLKGIGFSKFKDSRTLDITPRLLTYHITNIPSYGIHT